jgi:hypothetical protein
MNEAEVEVAYAPEVLDIVNVFENYKVIEVL